jgi:hypothetical protein
MLLTLDPGKKYAGVALFENRELVAAWLSRVLSHDFSRGNSWRTTANQIVTDVGKHVPLSAITHYAAEVPRIYPPSRSPGDPNKSCTPLILVVGGVGTLLNVPTTLYYPKDWKAEVKKSVMIERIWARLSVEERVRVELPGSVKNQGDVKDAIGVGLKWNKRL